MTKVRSVSGITCPACQQQKEDFGVKKYEDLLFYDILNLK